MSLARPIVRRVAAPFARGLTEPPLGGLDAAIRALFPDVIYDPSDLTTLFQDAAGTTPVTALEQPVGLMLDKSRGLVLGPELITNGDFSSDTWWQKDTGVTIAGGVCVFTAVTTSRGVYRSNLTAAGKHYCVTYTIMVNSGAIRVLNNGSLGTNRTASGTYTEIISGSSGSLFGLFANTSFDGTVDNVSVRELPGYHAYHTPGDTTTRPTVSRRINLLTKTEDFSDTGAWTTQRAKVSANSTTAPDGTLTADTLTETSETGSHQIYRIANFGVGTYTRSIYAKANGRTQFHFEQESGGNARFTLTGAGTALALGSNTVSITNVGNGWYRCTSTFTVTGGFGLYTLLYNGSSTSYTGDGTSGIHISGASIVPADLSSLPYQRVNTTTDYDSDASKFPTFLRTDGVNDSLQTNAIDFSGTDKMFVGAAVRKLSDAATGVLVEFGPTINSTNGAFVVTAPPNNGLARYGFGTRGTASQAFAGSSPYSYPAPRTDVLSGAFDHAALTVANGAVAPRVSGAAMPYATDGLNGTSAGNYGNHKLYLFMRAGTSLPSSGWFYGGLIKGATLSASQIALAERWLAEKTKTVTLA